MGCWKKISDFFMTLENSQQTKEFMLKYIVTNFNILDFVLLFCLQFFHIFFKKIFNMIMLSFSTHCPAVSCCLCFTVDCIVIILQILPCISNDLFMPFSCKTHCWWCVYVWTKSEVSLVTWGLLYIYIYIGSYAYGVVFVSATASSRVIFALCCARVNPFSLYNIFAFHPSNTHCEPLKSTKQNKKMHFTHTQISTSQTQNKIYTTFYTHFFNPSAFL